jgi:uncharacterized protein (DUF1778 family)
MSLTLERPRHTKRERKADTIDLRVTPAAKALLTAAAQASHTSMSEFVLRSAIREAESTLADRRVFQVSDEHWSAFMDILSAPAQPDPDLVALARSRTPWSG